MHATKAGAPVRGTRPSAHRQLEALSRDRMRQFLDRRVRFSALSMSVTLMALLIIKAMSDLWGTGWLVFASVLVTCTLALTTRLEQAIRVSDERALRRSEACIFGFTFACISCLAFASLEATSRTGELIKYLTTIRETLMISGVLVIVYGLAIPNSTGRSLAVSTGLAGITTTTIFTSLVIHGPAFASLPTSYALELTWELVRLMTIAVCCAAVEAGVITKIRENNINIDELGPYVLKSPLGSGGMGDVYLAEHRLLKRLCAVKLIHPDKAGDSRVKARFEQEVKATATLTHPNTVQVFDYGTTHGGRFFYAMEFLDGLNLQQYVEQFGPMPASRVRNILTQVCGALQEAWYEGLVHRDIKPSNIFLSERGHVFDVAKLLDFGLVRAALTAEVGMQRKSARIQGSPAFMCPEQASGIEPDCRGDLYSLGAVAWYLLTGYPPFQDDNPIMLIVAHATEKVPDLAETGACVPDDLAAVVMKCLSKAPEDRYCSPRELLLALDSCEACGEWSWRDAEEWWLANIPAYGERTSDIDDEGQDTLDMPQEAASHLEKTWTYDREVVLN